VLVRRGEIDEISPQSTGIGSVGPAVACIRSLGFVLRVGGVCRRCLVPGPSASFGGARPHPTGRGRLSALPCARPLGFVRWDSAPPYGSGAFVGAALCPAPRLRSVGLGPTLRVGGVCRRCFVPGPPASFGGARPRLFSLSPYFQRVPCAVVTQSYGVIGLAMSQTQHKSSMMANNPPYLVCHTYCNIM